MNNFGIFDFLNKLSDACTAKTDKNDLSPSQKEPSAPTHIIYKNTQSENSKKHYSDKEIMEATKKHEELSKRLDESFKK